MHRLAEAHRRVLSTAFHRIRAFGLEMASANARSNYEGLADLLEVQKEVKCACQRIFTLLDRTHRRDARSLALQRWKQFVAHSKHEEALMIIQQWNDQASAAYKAAEALQQSLDDLQVFFITRTDTF